MDLTNCNIRVYQGLKDEDGTEILNALQTSKYIDYVNFLRAKTFIQELQPKGWDITDLGRKDKQVELYTAIKKMFVKDFGNRELSPEIIDDLTKVLTKWDRFKQYHIKYSGLLVPSSELEIKETDTHVEENNKPKEDDQETADFMKNTDRRGNDKSTYDMSDNEIRAAFTMLVKKTADQKEIVDADGLPKMVDSGALFSLLANEFAGIRNKADFTEKFLSDKIRRQFPEIVQLQQIMQITNGDKNQQQMALYNKFYNLFTRAKIPIMIGTLSIENGETSYDMREAIKTTLSKIEEQYKANYQTKNIDPLLLTNHTKVDNSVDDATGKEIGNGRMMITSLPEINAIDFQNVENKDLNTLLKEPLDFLQLLGIKFSGLSLLSSVEKENYARTIYNISSKLRESVLKRIERGQKLYDPIADLKKKYEGLKPDTLHLKKIFILESEYSILQPSLSVKNAEGENEYLLSDHNHVSVSTVDLNSAKSINSLITTPAYINIKSNPLFNRSFLKSFLFDSDGNRKSNTTITVSKYNGFNKDTGDRTVNSNTADLPTRDKFIFDFNSYTKYNRIDTMRTAAKSTFLSTTIQKDGENVPYIHHSEFSKDFVSSPTFRTLMKGYLDGEIERIKSYPVKKDQNPALIEAYSKFSLFHSILPDELQQRIIQEKPYTENELFDNIEKAFSDEYNKIRKYIADENIDFDKDLFNKYSIENSYLEEGILTDNSKKELLRNYIANLFINNVETGIFFTGDPLFAPDKFNKMIGGIISNGVLTNNTGSLEDYRANNLYEKAFHNDYSLAGTLGIEHRDNQNDMLSAVLPDIENTDNAYTNGEIAKGIKASDAVRGETISSDEQIKAFLADKPGGVISPIVITDGAAWTSVDIHRELALKNGFHTPELEDAYKYEGLVYKRIKGLLTTDQKAELQDLHDKIMENPENYGIAPLKDAMFGPIHNATVDGKAMDKMLVHIALPSTSENHPEQLKLLDGIVNNQLAYVKHKTATKGFVRNIVNSLDELSTNKKDINYPDILSTNLLKQQMAPKTVVTKETTLLTQFTSLLFTNLFNEGEPINTKVGDAFKQYKGIFENLHEDQKQAVRSIGIELDENNVPISFNPQKLVDKINNQLGNFNSNSNLANAFHIKDGKLVGSIEGSGLLPQVQDFVLGFLDKTLKRYKLQGGNYTVVSPAYMKTELQTSKFNPEGTEKGETRVTFASAHKPLLSLIDPKDSSKTIGTIKRLNQLLNDKDFRKEHEKALTEIHGRPPIDGIHSMGVGIIREFFFPTAGSVIQFSKEFIKASGIDFDKDDEKVYFPYIIDGQVNGTNTNIKDIRVAIKDLEKTHEELRQYGESFGRIETTYNQYGDEIVNDNENVDKVINDIFKQRQILHPDDNAVEIDAELYNTYKQYLDLKENQRRYHINNLLGIIDKTLSFPESYSDMAIPNSSQRVKKIATDNANDLEIPITLPSLGEVYMPSSNLGVFDSFMGAKRNLPVFAKANTQNEFLKQGGLKVNQRYNIDKMGNAGSIIRLLLHTADEKKIILTDGQIQLGRKFTVEGENRQHMQGQFISNALEAEKDPSGSALGFNSFNISVAQFLEGIGLPPERIVNFVNNPLIKRYNSYREQGMTRAQAKTKALESVGIYGTGEEEKTAGAQEFMQDLKDGKVVTSGAVNNGMYDYTVKIQKAPEQWILKNIHNADYKAVNKSTDMLNSTKFSNAISPERLLELKTSKESYNIGDKNFADNLLLLSYFTENDNHTWKYRDAKYQFDDITSKIRSLNDVSGIKESRERLIKSGFVNAEELDKMGRKSLPSAFNHNEFIQKTLDLIFPNIVKNWKIGEHNENISDTFSKIISDYKYTPGKIRSNTRTLPKIITNDFLYSLLTNFGKYGDERFIHYGIKLIGKNSINTTEGERIGGLRRKEYWDKLKTTYPILDKLQIDAATNKHPMYTMANRLGNVEDSLPYNIKFVDGYDTTLSQEEGYIQQIKKLISPDFFFKSDALKTEDENKALSKAIGKVSKDALVTSLTQAGMSKSMLSFFNLIPPEFISKILSPAFEAFEKLSPDDKSLYMEEFRNKFKQNNPKFFANNSKTETWRGKDYRIQEFLGRIPDKVSEKTSPTEPPKPDVKIDNLDTSEKTPSVVLEPYKNNEGITSNIKLVFLEKQRLILEDMDSNMQEQMLETRKPFMNQNVLHRLEQKYKELEKQLENLKEPEKGIAPEGKPPIFPDKTCG